MKTSATYILLFDLRKNYLKGGLLARSVAVPLTPSASFVI
jgi:hypothetical protein